MKGNFIISNFYPQDRLTARLTNTGGPEKGEGYGGLRFVISYHKYRTVIDVGSRCHLEVPPGTCAVRAGPGGICRDERA